MYLKGMYYLSYLFFSYVPVNVLGSNKNKFNVKWGGKYPSATIIKMECCVFRR